MKRAVEAVEAIVNHHPKEWLQTATGEVHSVVWCCPHEVVSVSLCGTWRGKATTFIEEFEALP